MHGPAPEDGPERKMLQLSRCALRQESGSRRPDVWRGKRDVDSLQHDSRPEAGIYVEARDYPGFPGRRCLVVAISRCGCLPAGTSRARVREPSVRRTTAAWWAIEPPLIMEARKRSNQDPVALSTSRAYAGLLDGSFDKLSNTHRATLHGRIQLVPRDKSRSESARGCFDDYAGVGADVRDVGNGPSGGRDLHAEAVCHFISA